jgi:hypothetical protein
VILRALFFGNSDEFGQVSVDSERAFSDRLLEVVVKTAVHEIPDTIQTKEEAGKWSKKIRKCNVPCVGTQVQVNSLGIFVRVAA